MQVRDRGTGMRLTERTRKLIVQQSSNHPSHIICECSPYMIQSSDNVARMVAALLDCHALTSV